MTRTDLYLKVELDLPESEDAAKIAVEICRMVRKVYGVKSAEVQNIVAGS